MKTSEYGEAALLVKESGETIVRQRGRIDELEAKVSGFEKKAEVEKVIKTMEAKGSLGGKSAEEMADELLVASDDDLAVTKRALELNSGPPADIAHLSEKAANGGCPIDAFVNGAYQ